MISWVKFPERRRPYKDLTLKPTNSPQISTISLPPGQNIKAIGILRG